MCDLPKCVGRVEERKEFISNIWERDFTIRYSKWTITTQKQEISRCKYEKNITSEKCWDKKEHNEEDTRAVIQYFEENEDILR